MPHSTRILALFALGLLACDPAPTPEPAPPPSGATIEAKVRVRVAVAEDRALSEAGALTGTVEPFAEVVVAAETGARILARHVERGDRVEAGALLYSLDNSRARIEYSRAEASVSARERDRSQAELELGRAAKLRAREGISAAAHDRSDHAADSAAAAEELARISKRAAARGLRDAKIRAPFEGVVADFRAEQGDFVGPGTPVLTLVDLSRVRVWVGLTAAEIEGVELGARVPVSFADLGGERYEGELRSISPLVDPRSGTYAAELWLDNPGGRLRQGMLGRVELGAAEVRSDAGSATLTIPRGAVIRRGPDFSVWVVDASAEPARVHARALVLGRADPSRVAVHSGLEPGDTVVIEGMFALREGAAVDIETETETEIPSPTQGDN